MISVRTFLIPWRLVCFACQDEDGSSFRFLDSGNWVNVMCLV